MWNSRFVRSMSDICSSPGIDVGDQLADLLVALERRPVDRPLAEHALRQTLTARDTSLRGAGVSRRAAVAQPDVAEHRLLRRRLGLLVARQHRQHQRLLRGAPGVSGVERRRQVGDRSRRPSAWLGDTPRPGCCRTGCRRGTRPCPSRRGRPLRCSAIVSRPASVGSVQTETVPRGGRGSPASARASRRPMPMPCTLLWPRIGRRPACGRPTMPRSSARLTIICTLSTPFR